MSNVKSWIDKQTGDMWFSDGSREVKADPLVVEGMWTLEKQRTKTLTDEIGRLSKIVEREGDDQLTKAGFKVEFPMRQAMLSIRQKQGFKNDDGSYHFELVEVASVPVFVWPMPTSEGLFVVEHQDGTVQRVQPDLLTFLDSKELFDQYDWNDNETVRQIDVKESYLVRHMVNMSGKKQSDVSEEMGKNRNYITATVSRGNSPSALNLTKLAKACGYRLSLEGHGESITIVEG